MESHLAARIAADGGRGEQMKRLRFGVIAISGAMLGWVSHASFVADDFEAYSVNQSIGGNNGWQATDSSVIVTDSPAHWPGSRVLRIPPQKTVSNVVATGTKVWTDFWTVPRFFTNTFVAAPEIDLNATAMFYVSTGGQWVVIGKQNGQLVTNVINGVLANTNGLYGAKYTNVVAVQDGSTWYHVSVYKDYSAHTWSLFVNDIPVCTNLGFINDGNNSFQSFAVQNGGGTAAAFLDNVIFSNKTPPTLSADWNKDGMVDAWELMYFGGWNGVSSTANPDSDSYANLAESSFRSDPNDINDPAAGPFASAIPFTEEFDTLALASLNNQNGWSDPGSGSRVTNSPVYAGAGALALNGGATHSFLPNAAATQVWTHVALKPGTTVGTKVKTESIEFFVDTDRHLKVVSNSGTTDTGILVPSDAWTRLVVKSDYVAGNWAIYYGANSDYATQVMSGITFYNPAAQSYQWLTLTNSAGNGGYVDSVQITLSKPGTVITGGGSIPDTVIDQVAYTYPGATGSQITNAMYWGTTNGQGSITSIGVTNEVNNAVRLTFNIGQNPEYVTTNLVYGSPTVPGPYTNLLGTVVAGIGNGPTVSTNWIDAQGWLRGLRYFYKLVGTYDGISFDTNRDVYAWYRQPRPLTTNAFWVGLPPIDYGNQNTLGGTLGQQLLMALYPKSVVPPVYGDEMQVFDAGGGSTWYKLSWNGPNPAWASNTTLVLAPNDVVNNGVVIRHYGSSYRQGVNAVFSGKLSTNAVVQQDVEPGLQLIPLPLNAPTTLGAVVNLNNGFKTGTVFWVRESVATPPRSIRITSDGAIRWPFGQSGTPSNIVVNPGDALVLSNATMSTYTIHFTQPEGF